MSNLMIQIWDFPSITVPFKNRISEHWLCNSLLGIRIHSIKRFKSIIFYTFINLVYGCADHNDF